MGFPSPSGEQAFRRKLEEWKREEKTREKKGRRKRVTTSLHVKPNKKRRGASRDSGIQNSYGGHVAIVAARTQKKKEKWKRGRLKSYNREQFTK